VETVPRSALTSAGTALWIDQLEKPTGGTKLLRVDLGDGAYYDVEYRRQGENQFFGEIDRVIVRLKPGFNTEHPQNFQVWVDNFGLQRDGEQLFLNDVHPTFLDTYRRVMISVIETRVQNNVRQARLRVQLPPAGCGLLGAEALPLLAALAASQRRRLRFPRQQR